MFAIAQPNFTKQSCQTTIFHDPLITYRVWKIVDLIPQGSSSAGQSQMWYFTLLSIELVVTKISLQIHQQELLGSLVHCFAFKLKITSYNCKTMIKNHFCSKKGCAVFLVKWAVFVERQRILYWGPRVEGISTTLHWIRVFVTQFLLTQQCWMSCKTVDSLSYRQLIWSSSLLSKTLLLPMQKEYTQFVSNQSPLHWHAGWKGTSCSKSRIDVL